MGWDKNNLIDEEKKTAKAKGITPYPPQADMPR